MHYARKTRKAYLNGEGSADNPVRDFELDKFGLDKKHRDNPVIKASVLHSSWQMVKYDSRENRTGIRSYRNVFRHGGNCEEQSIYYASEAKHITGVDVRLVRVENEDRTKGHIFPEFSFPQVSNPIELIHTFGSAQFADREPMKSDIYFEEEDGKKWFPADPVNSDWIGDIWRLAGYWTKTSGTFMPDNPTDWYFVNRTHTIPV